MSVNSIAKELKDMLDANGAAYREHQHAPVVTSEEAHAVRPQYSLSQGTKSIIVRIKKRSQSASVGGEKQFFMLALAGDQVFDTKKVKRALDATDLRFARPEEVADITGGVEPGGIPPFGILFDLQTLADPKIFSHDTIVFNAGDRSVSLAIASSAYQSLVNPIVADIAQESSAVATG